MKKHNIISTNKLKFFIPMTEKQKDKILSFLKKENISVLAYNFNGQPRSAVIDFSETDSLEIVFTTLINYRKYENIKSNPKVALTFGGQNNITIQYEGVASEISRVGFLPFVKYHLQKNPIEVKFLKMLEARFFQVSPKWIRYSNFSTQPNEIFEIKL